MSWIRLPCSRQLFRRYGTVTDEVLKRSGWVAKKPVFKHLPPNQITETIKKYDFDTKDISKTSKYFTDEKFKSLLDKSMQMVYNNKVIASDKHTAQHLHYTWLKLRDYVYGQLIRNDTSEDSNFDITTLRDLMAPSNPNQLVEQLLNIDKINQNTWKKVMNEYEKKITKFQKYVYLISAHFDQIYGQEIVPTMTPSFDLSVETNGELSLLNPVRWFPEARKMKRKIIMHLGPTNSGKTYRALQRLKSVEQGYYAGPLRLLAREVYDNFKNENLRCNLLTGEEVVNDVNEIGTPAGLTSGTVEMVPLNKTFDVVVLDEIQMMGDAERGWAWTNAVLGVKAHELHLCGEKSVLPLIKKIVKLTGDELVINEYERLGELLVESKSLGKGMKQLRKGDCVVAFSKKKILDLKLEIERETNFKVAVIYGSLPPETRVQQANLFNQQKYDILVASDAIGMGLNLSVDRIIFTTNLKFDGKEMVELTSSNIKQIGGRAGRYKRQGSEKEERPKGFVTSFEPKVLYHVRKGLSAPIEYLDKAVIWPTDEICQQIAEKVSPSTSTPEILKFIESKFEESSEGIFKFSNLKTKLEILASFEHLPEIPFNERLRLANAPMKDMPLVRSAFNKFTYSIAKRETRGILSYRIPFENLDYQYIKDDTVTLVMYESLYNIVNLFFWLGNRYPNYFIDLDSAKDLKLFCELLIFEKLTRLKKNPYADGSRVAISTFYKKRSLHLIPPALK